MPQSPAAVFERLSTAKPPTTTPLLFDQAVVLGGSMAGLLAARVLADHAKSVVIIERDDADARPAGDARPGVPQGSQVHALLPGGRTQLERWFPGLTLEACTAGAVLAGPDSVAVYADDVRQVRTDNAVLLSASRPFLETLIRRRTLALPNVRVVAGVATGLTYADGAVTSAQYLGGEGSQTERADFTVDAMGRSSRLSDWLEKDGWERPALERMKIDVNYATAFFKRAEAEPAIGAAIARYHPRFTGRAVGAVSAIEDGLWMVMLAGYGDDHPGRTPEDFRARCAGLPPIFGQAAQGEPVGEVHPYHQADSRRRDFAALGRLPARLVAVGDAVASFNPVYGQGMSSAALHASALSDFLRGNPDLGVAARGFLAAQKVLVDAAWDISAAADAVRLGVPPNPPAKLRLQRWVVDQILAASIVDEKVAVDVNNVTFMSTHPSTLARPGLALRAIAANRRARKAPR